VTEKLACSACGGPTRVERGTYHFREAGLPNVYLQGLELVRCQRCKNVDPLLPRLNHLMRTLALGVIRKPCRLRGEELRFLRKHMDMTGTELCRLLHVDRATLSKWENNEDPVGIQSDRLIRLLALSLIKGLRGEAAEVRKLFPEIQDTRKALRIDVNAETLEYEYV